MAGDGSGDQEGAGEVGTKDCVPIIEAHPEDQAIAALLHDGPEDQGGHETLAEIERRFGPEVARIVLGCTDNLSTEKRDWRTRKEAYLTHLWMAPDDVRLVCASDKLHNARSILVDYRRDGDATWARFAGGKAGSLWYYRALTNIFLHLGPQRIAGELNLVVSELERLAEASKAAAGGKDQGSAQSA